MITYNDELKLHQDYQIPTFEGWYFRIVNPFMSIAVIIGIAKTNKKQEVFIQLFHTLNNDMEKVSYDMSDFEYKEEPFEIRIKNNIFREDYLHIQDEHLSMGLNVRIEPLIKLKQNLYAPTIMGPFSYLKMMQCHHGIINLGSHIRGSYTYEYQKRPLMGIVYQEKDWGRSFPKKYIWIQSNCCKEKQGVLFLSIALIPISSLSFTGIIMFLKIDGKEYRFASYYGAILTHKKRTSSTYEFTIRQGIYRLEFEIEMGELYHLEAPKLGEMNREVKETLLGETKIKIYKCNKCIETLSFYRCGIEHDQFFETNMN